MWACGKIRCLLFGHRLGVPEANQCVFGKPAFAHEPTAANKSRVLVTERQLCRRVSGAGRRTKASHAGTRDSRAMIYGDFGFRLACMADRTPCGDR